MKYIMPDWAQKVIPLLQTESWIKLGQMLTPAGKWNSNRTERLFTQKRQHLQIVIAVGFKCH